MKADVQTSAARNLAALVGIPIDSVKTTVKIIDPSPLKSVVLKYSLPPDLIS